MSKKIKLFGSVRILCISAVLTAATVVIAYLCKFWTLPGGTLRITFENLPIIFAGFVFGPYIGLAVGTCADLLSSLVHYGIGGINPIITLGAGCVGLMAGVMSRVLPRKSFALRLGISVGVAHTTGNIIIKSVGLMAWYGSPIAAVLPRIPLYICIAALEYALLLPLIKSKGMKKMIGALQ